MSTNKTQHYGLHLWEPEDAFVRTEFNENSENVDAALHSAAVQSRRALQSAETAGYHTMNLMLQNYYDGKYTGWKKALLFDGFRNKDLIQSLSDTLVRGDGYLALTRTPEQSEYVTTGDDYRYGPTPVTTAIPVTVAGRCKLWRVGVMCKAASSAYEGKHVLRFTVSVNGIAQPAMNFSFLLTQTNEYYPLYLHQPIWLEEGDVVGFSCLDVTANTPMAALSHDPQKMYGTYYFRSLHAPTGTMTSRAQALPACNGLLAWVRHTGGDVSLSVKQNGVTRALAAAGTRETRTLQGDACTESAFRLDQPLEVGDLSLLLTANLGDDNQCKVWDYGMLALA